MPCGVAMTLRVVVAGALIEDGALLVAQRARPAELAGQWELPGGKKDGNESEAQALVREMREELAVDVAVHERVGADVSLGPDLVLRAYRVERLRGTPTALDHRALARVTADELAALNWVAADRTWIKTLDAMLRFGR